MTIETSRDWLFAKEVVKSMDERHRHHLTLVGRIDNVASPSLTRPAVNPWLRKFRGLSKRGLEQAAHTFGLIRSLNLAGESVETTIDCLVIGSFRSSA